MPGDATKELETSSWSLSFSCGSYYKKNINDNYVSLFFSALEWLSAVVSKRLKNQLFGGHLVWGSL